MKVAVYAICGAGEEPNVAQFLSTTKDADYVCVAHTAYELGTWGAFARGIAITRPCSITPFRFDDARNFALAMVPDAVDVCIALDMDETLEIGWRDALEASMPLKLENPTAWWVDFNFNGTVFRQNNRVHSRHGWRWKHPCHEALMPNMARVTDSVEVVPGFTITHRPDVTKPRPNYLEMLAWGQWEEPNSLRMLHYYGRELMFNGYYKDALERFNRYLYLDRMECSFPAERMKTEEYRDECAAKP